MNRKKIVHNIKQRLLEIDPGAKIILYGSEARGEANQNSDIDVLILLNKNQSKFELKTRINNALYDIELETGIIINPLIYPKKEWENRPFKNPFYINVMNEGIEL
ncbi:MAG TPA: nucleotidyltransferase domain-containing protein [Prolixibacteraceae bacterium]|nr:nucleotidyltransferase domain-containing protein [Prolixibacteraceae bacterium]